MIDLSRATSAAVPGVHAAAERALTRLPARLTTDGYELSGLPALRETLAARYTAAGVPTSPEQHPRHGGKRERHLADRADAGLARRSRDRRGARLPALERRVPRGGRAAASDDRRRRHRMGSGGVRRDRREGASHARLLDAGLPQPDQPEHVRRGARRLRRRRGEARHVDRERRDDRRPRHRPEFGDAPARGVRHAGRHRISVGSASKTMWGGLRVGWIRAASTIIDRLHRGALLVRPGSGRHRAAHRLGAVRLVRRHLDYRRELHRRSRDTLATALETHLPNAHLHRVEGGVASWIRFDDPISSALTVAARGRGLLIGAGPVVRLSGEFERNIRVPITATPESIERAIEILADSMSDVHVPVPAVSHSRALTASARSVLDAQPSGATTEGERGDHGGDHDEGGADERGDADTGIERVSRGIPQRLRRAARRGRAPRRRRPRASRARHRPPRRADLRAGRGSRSRTRPGCRP